MLAGQKTAAAIANVFCDANRDQEALTTDPLSATSPQSVGKRAKIGHKVHPHMPRHAAGFVLANRGVDAWTLQAYLGHRSIQSTVRYTELAPNRFKNLWK